MPTLSRRSFLAAAAVAAPTLPIIDTHIHLFDQTRPQGAPYSGGGRNTLPALPARYRKLAQPLGISGAIVVEASPWIEDNLWAIEQIQSEPMLLGLIGNLRPEKPEFAEYLERYHRNPLFLGIRYGNIWGYSLAEQSRNPVFVDGLRLVEQAGLTMDTANPRADLLEAVLRVTDRLPRLRLVIDHLPGLLWRLSGGEMAAVDGLLRELAQRPLVYVKVSAVMRMVAGRPSTDAALYRPVLDQLYDTFGPDRLLLGSDWPNADAVDNLPAIVRIARQYFETKGRDVCEKVYQRNAQAAYRFSRDSSVAAGNSSFGSNDRLAM